MKTKSILSLLSLILITQLMLGQHTAPIIESYLSKISVVHDNENIKIDLEYSKTGGRVKKAFQIYLIAYLEKNETMVLNNSLNHLENDSLTVILSTELIKRNEKGSYNWEYSINTKKLVNTLITNSILEDNSKESFGGYGKYKTRLKLIVFIPFLNDKKYSTSRKLQRDKQDGRYKNKQYLLFHSLPYLFEVHFGIVQGKTLGEDNYYIQIDGS